MKTWKKAAAVLFAAVLAESALMPGFASHAAETGKKAGKVSIVSKENTVPTYQAGESREWVLTVINETSAPVEQITVTPDLGESGQDWPFQTQVQDYRQEIGSLQPEEARDVAFTFVQREDVPTARYTIRFLVASADSVLTEKKFYVNTTAKPEAEKPSGGQEDSGNEQQSTGGGSQGGSDYDLLSADAGGFSNGGASYSGGAGGNGSVPRVIVTGFTTDPAEVRAGSDFTLTIHLKNTSKTMRVSNMLFDMEAPTEGKDEQSTAPAFLPTSGSSSVYLEGIAAGGTADISIQLNAKADLLQKPYSMELNMKYEDANAQQIEAASSVSIPVKQDARFEFSDFEISPESIAVGEEANVMCSLYNLGRIKLYNLKAVFEGACIEKEEVFIGNVESGATASIDAMLEGKKAGKGPGKVTMTVSYEDESGNISKTTKDFQLEVLDAVEEEMPAEAMMPEETSSGFPVLPVVLLAALVVILAVVFVIKKKKKARLTMEEEGLLDELDRPSEDEH